MSNVKSDAESSFDSNRHEKPEKMSVMDKHRPMSNPAQTADEQASMAAFLREHPHLQQASPAWQKFYYRIRMSVQNQ